MLETGNKLIENPHCLQEMNQNTQKKNNLKETKALNARRKLIRI